MGDLGDDELKDEELRPLVDALKSAIDEVYKEAKPLPTMRGLEQAIVFRVGVYFSKWVSNSEYAHLDLDCEYNKSKDKLKETPNFPNGIRPDMLLHKRKLIHENVLCVEFKGWWQSNHRKDKLKLRDLTNSANPNFSYRLGLFVNLQKENHKITYFHPWHEGIEL